MKIAMFFQDTDYFLILFPLKCDSEYKDCTHSSKNTLTSGLCSMLYLGEHPNFSKILCSGSSVRLSSRRRRSRPGGARLAPFISDALASFISDALAPFISDALASFISDALAPFISDAGKMPALQTQIFEMLPYLGTAKDLNLTYIYS